MNRFKKFLSAMLVVFVITSFTTVPFAASNSETNSSIISKISEDSILSAVETASSGISTNLSFSTREKAEALNILNILKGNEQGDFLLGEQLERSQAATFIVRLVGKEEHVLNNKANYNNTVFTDVPRNAWYAPYVGYCSENGIIAGVGDNLYKPNDKLSEKELLKLVLTALGYEYGSGRDFDWTNVFEKAYQVKLVDDPIYLTKTADNRNYTRGEVVKVLFNSLGLVHAMTGVTILDMLIESGSVTRDQAMEAGLIADTSTDGIREAVALDSRHVIIYFDKPVNDIGKTDVRIYETKDFTKSLTAEIISQDENYVLVRTDEHTPFAIYTVELYGVRVKGSAYSKTMASSFVGYKPSEVNSEFFRINKVEPISKTSINVYFTHPVTLNSAIPEYYVIEDSSGAVFASGSGKTLNASYSSHQEKVVTVTLAGKLFTKDEQYTLKVSGDLTSMYGVKLNEGNEDSLIFKGVDTEPAANVAFELTSATTVDAQTLQLTFNRELHPTRAEQVFSYYITDFNGSPVQINKAVLTGSGNLKNRVVHLSIPGAFITGKAYKLKINELNDITRQYSILDKDTTFVPTATVASSLRLLSASAVDKGTIRLKFNKSLDPASAQNVNSYLITGTTTSSGTTTTVFSTLPQLAYFNEDTPDTVLLYMPADKLLNLGVSYKVTVTAVKDYLGAIPSSLQEASFAGTNTAVAKPTFSDAVIISGDTIKVTFSKPIALSENNISVNNYLLHYDLGGYLMTKVPALASYINSTTMILKFDALDLDQTYTLSFNELTDQTGLYTSTAAEGNNKIKVRTGK
jgi:hypothetical protein